MRYDVLVPVCGFVMHKIDADSPEAAIEAAMDEDFKMEDVQDLNQYKEINNGNVCNAEYSEAEATESDEDGDSDPSDSDAEIQRAPL